MFPLVSVGNAEYNKRSYTRSNSTEALQSEECLFIPEPDNARATHTVAVARGALIYTK